MTARAGIAAIFALLCLGEVEARAQIAIEAHRGPRANVAGPTLKRLQPIFLRYGINAAPNLILPTLQLIARPGIADPKLTYLRIVDRVDLAANMIFRSTPEMLPGVRAQLESVIADVRANPAIVAVEEGSRDMMTRAYAHLALCRYKQGDKKAALEVIAEQARSYPEVPLVRGKFGSDVESLYNEVRAGEMRIRRGELAIDARRADAEIYVNEFNRGQGGRFQGRLLPGPYRVVVRVGDKSLAYDVNVRPDRATRLDVDWQLELALTATDESIGVTLTSPTPVAEERALTIAMSRKAGGVSSIVMIDVSESSSVAVALYERIAADKQPPTAQLSRRGRIALTGDGRDDERLDALAQFISKGITSPHVTDVTETHRDNAIPSAQEEVSPFMPIRPTDSEYDHAAAAERTKLRSVRSNGRGTLPLILIGAGGLAMIAGGVAYALDEDDATTGRTARTYTDTAPIGIGIGAAGVASIGAGVWLWQHRTKSAPTIAVSPSAAVLGWTGSF